MANRYKVKVNNCPCWEITFENNPEKDLQKEEKFQETIIRRIWKEAGEKIKQEALGKYRFDRLKSDMEITYDCGKSVPLQYFGSTAENREQFEKDIFAVCSEFFRTVYKEIGRKLEGMPDEGALETQNIPDFGITLQEECPSLTPINLINPETGYKSAAKWASENLMNLPYDGSRYIYGYIPFVNMSTDTHLKTIQKKGVVCYQSCLVAYANGDEQVNNYLIENGFALNEKSPTVANGSRKDAVDWFKKGGKYHSFIEAKNLKEGSIAIGDILFKGKNTDSDGHAAIVASEPVWINENRFSIDCYSTGTTGNVFGLKSYTFNKGENNTWKDDVGGQSLTGFGRIDEDGIKTNNQIIQNNNTLNDDECD